MRSSLLLVLVACASPRADSRSAGRSAGPRASKPAPKSSDAVALTPEVALARIESTYRIGVQRCYESRLKRDPSARGQVVVTFTVDDRGKLASARAQGVHRSLALCVERAMMRWSFPAPREETTFRVALRLSSRS